MYPDYRSRAEQPISFSTLSCGPLMPTDIDGVMDWKGRCYVLLEYKTGDKPMSLGQEICLTRMADDLTSAGKPTLLVLAEHDTPTNMDISAGECDVRGIYWEHEWNWGYKGLGRTVAEVVWSFIDAYGGSDG